MSDLVEFLRARLDEDEQVAENAKSWCRHGGWSTCRYGLQVGRCGSIIDVDQPPVVTDHMARHDPARVLAEVEAKRRILERHRPEYRLRIRDGEYVQDETPYCPDHLDERSWPCADILDMAAVYADHPDYDEEWRP